MALFIGLLSIVTCSGLYRKCPSEEELFMRENDSEDSTETCFDWFVCVCVCSSFCLFVLLLELLLFSISNRSFLLYVPCTTLGCILSSFSQESLQVLEGDRKTGDYAHTQTQTNTRLYSAHAHLHMQF